MRDRSPSRRAARWKSNTVATTKIVCVPNGDPNWSEINGLSDLPEELRNEISQFFETYKQLEPGMHSRTGRWHDREQALAVTQTARECFQRKQAERPEERITSMLAHIEVTPEQANALATLSERIGTVALHQIGGKEDPGGQIYATSRQDSRSYAIAIDGTAHETHERLPEER